MAHGGDCHDIDQQAACFHAAARVRTCGKVRAHMVGRKERESEGVVTMWQVLVCGGPCVRVRHGRARRAANLHSMMGTVTVSSLGASTARKMHHGREHGGVGQRCSRAMEKGWWPTETNSGNRAQVAGFLSHGGLPGRPRRPARAGHIRGLVQIRAYRRDQGGTGSLKMWVSTPLTRISASPIGQDLAKCRV